MYYVGIDLHKRFMVIALEDETGAVGKPLRLECQHINAIKLFFQTRRPFRAVIEASGCYRWLYDLLSPLGEVVLAHPLRLRAIVSGRAKTDKLDSALLAKLLRADMIPTAYVPPKHYQELRDVTRARARLSRRKSEAKNELHALLTRTNHQCPHKDIFTMCGLRWLNSLDLGFSGNVVRNELVQRIEHYDREMAVLDDALDKMAADFPEVEALMDIHGVGLYSALLIVAEIGEPERFPNGRKVGSYAGLTARVNQSGDHNYHGNITRQGSPWLRWILVQVAMRVIRQDVKLKNFHTRIRKRSSAKIARVATARKLASICWVRLMRWHQLNEM